LFQPTTFPHDQEIFMTSHLDKFILERSKAVLVVVDVQQRLVPAMPQDIYQQVRGSIDFLVRGARLLNVPVVATEQYPKGIGATVPELAEACRDKVIEKLTFGCCGEPAFLEHLRKLDRPQVVVTGMEAHVCVHQTVLGLLHAGLQVHLVRDAIMSRFTTDYANALELARQAGAVVTTAETVLFQLMETSAAPEFKAASALIKERSAQR
jgi:nicotinamidase-related amidase